MNGNEIKRVLFLFLRFGRGRNGGCDICIICELTEMFSIASSTVLRRHVRLTVDNFIVILSRVHLASMLTAMNICSQLPSHFSIVDVLPNKFKGGKFEEVDNY